MEEKCRRISTNQFWLFARRRSAQWVIPKTRPTGRAPADRATVTVQGWERDQAWRQGQIRNEEKRNKARARNAFKSPSCVLHFALRISECEIRVFLQAAFVLIKEAHGFGRFHFVGLDRFIDL